MRVPRILAIAAIVTCPGISAGCGGDLTSSQSDFSLSAVVNGIVWHPEGSGSLPSAVLFTGENSLSLAGLRSTGSYREQIGIQLRNVTGPGTYALGDPATSSAGYFIVSAGRIADGSFGIFAYWTTTTRGGSVVISTFDPVTRTVQGTFAFEAESGGESITITNGSFVGHYDVAPE